MDTHGDSVNLGEEEIIKSTQFFSEDINGSQVPSNAEARIIYGTSQSAAYSQTPYVPYTGMRPPRMNLSQESRCPPMSQIPYGQLNAWPNYGAGIGPGAHPMMHLLGSGFYPHFPTGSFNGMVPAYGGPSHGGLTDNFLQAQARQPGGAHHNVEWSNMQNVVPPVNDQFQRPPLITEPERNQEVNPLYSKPTVSGGGRWMCPRSRLKENEEPGRSTASEVQVLNGRTPQTGNNSTRNENGAHLQPSELRQSPPPSSANTQQGPLPSNSVVAEYTIRAADVQKNDGHARPPCEGQNDLQEGTEDSSKSTIPYSLSKRKALREDEKSYLKEVKLAISEGRVPQVTVTQDENGNLVRYKSQFLNALKLAAQAVVQDAYIDVNEQETMNDIMEEMRRQFRLLRPLPIGMVEEYLRSYFKRCRLEYHQFWIKNGGRKKPDGCKQAAWLELVEYWKSTEGSKECQQNRMNASAEKPKLEKKKQKSGEDYFLRDENVAEVEATGSPCDQSGYSDSLDFKSATPLTTTRTSPVAVRNPMEDISNQLHNAVDNILSSFAASCRSVPSSNMKTMNAGAHIQVPGSQSLKGSRLGMRTPSEVLGSLQRPEVRVSKVEDDWSTLPNPKGQSRMVGKLKFNERMKTTYNAHSEFVGAKEDTVFLSSDASSDASSDGAQITGTRKADMKRHDNVAQNIKRVYTDKIEGWPCKSIERECTTKLKGKEPIIENNVSMKVNQSQAPYLSQTKQKLFMEKDEANGYHGRQELVRGMSFKNIGRSSREGDIQDNSPSDCRSDEENEDQDKRNIEFGGSSEEEEAPVLPREIVKRSVDGDYGGTGGKKEVKATASRKKSKIAVKKQKGTQIDESILKKLEFYKRPKNSHPIKTRTRVWVLHPECPGKVVAEATAGVNRKSRCVDSANEICKEGQQMIHVLRVIYKNTTVMYDKESRFPKEISYLDQAEGLANTPVLWCVSHLVEIPPFHQITKLLGNFVQPLSQEAVNSDSDFKNSRKKKKPNSTVVIGKETRKGRITTASTGAAQGSKVCRTILRSTKA